MHVFTKSNSLMQRMQDEAHSAMFIGNDALLVGGGKLYVC